MTHSIARYSSSIAHRLSRHQHFLLILVAFVTFRLLMPFVFRNGSYFVEQAPDTGDFLRWGTLAESGLYPYIDYSWDYPPLLPWLVIGLYRLSALLPAWNDQRLWFSVVLQMAMVVADTGSLILIYAIGQRMGSRARALRAAALFAASFIMAYAASGWYESVPVFLMLLALYLTLSDRHAWSMLTIGIGFVTKIVPVAIAPAVLKRLGTRRQKIAHTIGLAAMIAALLLPFLLTGADHLLAFVRVAMNRPTWLSLWAVFDGNYQFGATLPIIDRFSPASVGTPDTSGLPWPLIHLAFLALFLVIYTRRIHWRVPAITVAFAGLTTNLLLLWSKGFSGQFTAYAAPFVVLMMPNLRGALYAGLLGVLWVAEWPIAFNMLDGQDWFIAWLVIVRTLVVIAVCLEYAKAMFSSPAQPTPGYRSIASRLAGAILLIGWISVVPASIAAVSAYTQSRLAADPATPAIDFVRGQQRENMPVVIAGTKLYRRLYPAARALGEVQLLPGSATVPADARAQWLNDLTARSPFWLIAEQDEAEAERWLSTEACPIDTTAVGSARVSRFSAAPTSTPQAHPAAFGDEIMLNEYRIHPSAVKAGEALCVELNWSALKAPSGDYTVFIHVVDSNGQLVAQNDLPPQNSYAPTSHWPIGTRITDRHGIMLPQNLPAGDYTLRIGLYRSDDQSPVPVTRGALVLPDAIGIVLATLSVEP